VGKRCTLSVETEVENEGVGWASEKNLDIVQNTHLRRRIPRKTLEPAQPQAPRRGSGGGHVTSDVSMGTAKST